MSVSHLHLFLFLYVAVSMESTPQPPHKFILSPCGSPMSINFTGIFNAYETACTQFRANSHLDIVNISFNFDDFDHTSSPADLDVSITSLASQVAVHIGGWDDDVRITEDFEWPNEWQFSAEAGLYSAALNVFDSFLDDDGVYEICIMNKWLNSGKAIYNGLIQLQGMITDCNQTQAPSSTPEITATSSSECVGQAGVDVTFDVSFAGRETKCIPPFLAQGDLLAVNVDFKFTPTQLYIGVVPVQQTMWAADLELSLTQLSTNQSVVVGYDPLDNGAFSYLFLVCFSCESYSTSYVFIHLN